LPFTVADADFGGKTQDAKQRNSFNFVTQLLNLIFFTNNMLKGTEINVPKQICFFLPYSGYVKGWALELQYQKKENTKTGQLDLS